MFQRKVAAILLAVVVRLSAIRLSVLLIPLGLPCAGAAADTFKTAVQPFLEKYCHGCHNSKLASGGLSLQAYPAFVTQDRERWEQVLDKLQTGQMPPAAVPRPPKNAIASVTRWMESEFDRLDRSARPDPGRSTARRLNRSEYNNTIRDLLGVDFQPAADFPPDDSGYGFDNIGDALSMSPSMLEKYLAAADKAAHIALFGVPALKPTLIKHEPWYIDFDEGKEVKTDYDLTGLSLPSALHVMHRFPVEGDYDFGGLLRGTRPDGSEPLKVAYWVDGKQVKVIEYAVPEGGEVSGQRKEFRIHMTAGEHWLAASFLRIYEGLPSHYNGPNPSTKVVKQRAGRPTAGNLPRQATTAFFVSNLEIVGPFDQKQGPAAESLKKIYVCGNAAVAPDPVCARKIVSSFATRAFRRPATAQEVDSLLALISTAQKEGESFQEGLCLAIEKTLISPHFLFRIEQDRRGAAGALGANVDDFELATRLSYFLWSSMPDEALSQAAAAHQLHQPVVLSAHIQRMLRDPKSQALVENFGGQWLQFRALESHLPDRKKFQEYTEYTRLSLEKETELFFENIIREDRSILDFIQGKYSFLNQRLAEYYAVPGVTGPEFRRVDLSNSPRVGILTQGSVLTVSSYANRTSPVLRGKWILENILNTPPPPPPANVPTLDEAAVGTAGSLRQQLEEHRANATCASCHSRMDPMGFSLENFDAIGKYRAKDGKFDIDPSGVLPDGRVFHGADGLAAVLRSKPSAFAQGMTERMLTYALGRGLEPHDRAVVKNIVARLAADQYRFSALIREIVNSVPFQMRRVKS